MGHDGGMMTDPRARLADARLYLCTDGRRERGDLAPFLDAVLGNGVDIVQLREKGLEAGEELALLEVFAAACARHGALLSAPITGGRAPVIDFHAVLKGSNSPITHDVKCSDLAVIAPDQRLYRQQGVPDDQQPVKPVTYSVVKTGLIGLTRYLATYWATSGVRVNAISPGGVFNNQPAAFLAELHQRIPLARMAHADEYQGAILFLCSDASSYMTGANLVVDGGRTCW